MKHAPRNQSANTSPGQTLQMPLSWGAERTLAICRRYGILKAILAKWSPSCDASGITGKLLRENGIEVINVF